MNFKKIIFLILISITFSLSAKDYKHLIEEANQLYYSNPDSSFQLLKSIEHELIETKGDSVIIAKVKSGLLKYLALKTRYEEAINILKEILPFFERNKLYNDAAYCYMIRSVISSKINDPENDIKYAKIALDYYKKSNNIEGQVRILTNLCNAYNKFQMLDSAYNTLNTLFKYELKMSDSDKYYFYQNFGNYYALTNKNISAIENYKKALILAEKEEMLDSRATILMLIGEAYLNLKEYTSAERYLNQSINLSRDNNLIFELNEAYDQLINMYEHKGDYKNAFLYKKVNDSIRNEIFNLEKINKINEYESQLQLSEKEKLIAEKDLSLKKEQLHNIEAKSKITTLLFIVITCLLLIVFVFIIFFRAKKLNSEIKHQKAIVEEKNKEITSSITYAKRIQNAILPPDSAYHSVFPNNFIFYLPKDIVAGDFYWLEQEGKNILFAAADCTGHGVPGAMVSVVCNNALNRSVREFHLKKPSEILDKVSFLVEETFEKSVNEVRDGMDITLCNINIDNLQLEYSGANNSLYLIRDQKLIEYKADRQPVGKYFKKKPFTNHVVQLEKNDTIYLFTDGYADQFGGPKGKKFMYKPFKELLIELSSLSVVEQKNKLETTFYNWKGDHEQMDDICIIGIQI